LPLLTSRLLKNAPFYFTSSSPRNFLAFFGDSTSGDRRFAGLWAAFGHHAATFQVAAGINRRMRTML